MKRSDGPFTVVVGNVGTIGSYKNYVDACKVFGDYKRMSHSGHGRAAGERVALCNAAGDPVLEYEGADGE